ncbi:MAG: TPM domain-containing protein [Myxococcales bacterium]|nr:TPM domain-containing protein [Myxococcales bacterium]
MRPRKKIFEPDQEAILVRAIADAERRNRGEVRVHIERFCPETDAMDRAAVLFELLGMEETAADTGVLLYVATESRECAVFAGEGIVGAREPGYWQGVADALARGFARHDPIAGFEMALMQIGELLREVVPGDDAAGNELPNAVSSS